MYVHTYIYIYIYIYTHTHIHTHIHVYVYVREAAIALGWSDLFAALEPDARRPSDLAFGRLPKGGHTR